MSKPLIPQVLYTASAKKVRGWMVDCTRTKFNRNEKEELMKQELDLLKEAYVFIAMRHKALQPWRKSLDEWQEKVEALTGWSDFETIEEWREENGKRS